MTMPLKEDFLSLAFPERMEHTTPCRAMCRSIRLDQEAEAGVRGKHYPELLSYFPQERQGRLRID